MLIIVALRNKSILPCAQLALSVQCISIAHTTISLNCSSYSFCYLCYLCFVVLLFCSFFTSQQHSLSISTERTEQSLFTYQKPKCHPTITRKKNQNKLFFFFCVHRFFPTSTRKTIDRNQKNHINHVYHHNKETNNQLSEGT